MRVGACIQFYIRGVFIMSMSGVFKAEKKDGTIYYRSSVTYKNKHISLGSYNTELAANRAYSRAKELLESDIKYSELSSQEILDEFARDKTIKFNKFISIINFRDNNIYIKNPIYICKRFFMYFYSPDHVYIFDIEDLFYYASHKIAKRGSHLFVADYGMQINLLSRYGIHSHAVVGRDYKFKNNDPYDFRYGNIEVINKYVGVQKKETKTGAKYKAIILINGNYVIGTYPTEVEAAIAYNKACDMLKPIFPDRVFRQNIIDSLNPKEYARMYLTIEVSDKIQSLARQTV